MSIRFLKTHEWLNGNKVGISNYAQDQLGDIVYVSLPQVGDKVYAGKSFCEVESVKAVSEVNSPVTGTVVAVNEALNDKPEFINSNPYDAWIIEVEIESEGELLSQADYDKLIA
ncbi:MAG: glycine cleavage system protein GcvH [Clostridia bacterium]|nr:glycine cleavage system protein GcvH [Clostridia bacterium]